MSTFFLNPTALIITVCMQNKARIPNVIKNITKYQDHLNLLNITPVFVIAKEEEPFLYQECYLQEDSPLYKVLPIEAPTGYSTLWTRLLLAYRTLAYDKYTHFIKVDDDTLWNADRFQVDWWKYDYVGRMMERPLPKITMELPNFNMHTVIKMYPEEFEKESFTFATGDFYMFSKAASLVISAATDAISFHNKDHICEDQLLGWILNKNPNLLTMNITRENDHTDAHWLQVTLNKASIHPVNQTMMGSLISKSPEEQLEAIIKAHRLNLDYRKVQISLLVEKLQDTMLDFLNKPRSMGLG